MLYNKLYKGFVYGGKRLSSIPLRFELDHKILLLRTNKESITKNRSKLRGLLKPSHYINIVKRTGMTVLLANALYVVFGQIVAIILSTKASLGLGSFRKELTLLSIYAVAAPTIGWATHMFLEARTLGKYTKRVELSLLYGSLLFIASEIFLFSSLISTSFDRFANQTPLDRVMALEYLTETNPLRMSEVWLATLVLVGSSAALNAYKAHYDSFDESVSRILNGRAVQFLGLGFVSIQLAEYVGNWAVIHLNSGAGAFFMVTGFHGLHVIIGLILVVQQIELAHSEMKTTTNVGLYYSVIYWHFVDAVWIIVVMVIYVTQLRAEIG